MWIAQAVTAERGYTLDAVSEQTPEIFDDLYLGLQAGGALRKKRRGEELTEQEEAALGRWQRLSVWRKVVAIGAFALGTFGLGFTLGGLIFGRRRAKASRSASGARGFKPGPGSRVRPGVRRG